jgi:hypothetical protein
METVVYIGISSLLITALCGFYAALSDSAYRIERDSWAQKTGNFFLAKANYAVNTGTPISLPTSTVQNIVISKTIQETSVSFTLNDELFALHRYAAY